MPPRLRWDYIATARRGVEYVLARLPVFKRGYWRYAPTYYRWRLRRNINHDLPLDPLKVVWVETEEINRLSGRRGATTERWKDVGSIRAGNWDQRSPLQSSGKKSEYLSGVMSASTIEETLLYSSIKDRILDDCPWENTEIFQRTLEAIDNGIVAWRGSASRSDLLQRCNEVDKLCHILLNEGYKTQLDLLKENGLKQKHVGYLDLISDEITVDIGRDGELLFVDGRHRMCIAKVIGLKTVPICILARHKQWLQRREKLYKNNNNISFHPDFAEISK